MLSFSRFRILDTVFARSCGALLAPAVSNYVGTASSTGGVEFVVDLIYAAKLYAN